MAMCQKRRDAHLRTKESRFVKRPRIPSPNIYAQSKRVSLDGVLPHRHMRPRAQLDPTSPPLCQAGANARPLGASFAAVSAEGSSGGNAPPVW